MCQERDNGMEGMAVIAGQIVSIWVKRQFDGSVSCDVDIRECMREQCLTSCVYLVFGCSRRSCIVCTGVAGRGEREAEGRTERRE